jgi:hypothetical protein
MRFIHREKRRQPLTPPMPFVAVLSQYSDDELLAFDKAYAVCKYNGARDVIAKKHELYVGQFNIPKEDV